MFKIGDKIFYPMHGAGVIESIDEKEILGEKKLYYILNIPSKKMSVMIPQGNEDSIGIRPVVDSKILEEVLTTFHQEETDPNMNQNQRYRMNMNKIKSGDIYEGAQVIRDLMRISKKRNLGTDDRNLLNQAQQIFVSELSLIKDINQESATDFLNQIIHS